MQKTILERFISKYNLGGASEAVMWNSNEDAVTVTCISDDKNVLATVSTPHIALPKGEYGIFDTSQLHSLLGVLDDTINLRVKSTKSKATSFVMDSVQTTVSFVLADPAVIPPAPGLKQLPKFEMELEIDKKFVDTFIRAKGALSDVDTFTVLQDGATPQVILGYSDMNTNRVTIDVTATKAPDQMAPINFSARFMKEILMANKEATGGKLRISSKGLAEVTFSLGGDFDVTYYLVQIQTAIP